ncbi:MAG: DNA primase [Alphaproteobacteria bacterium]|nr:DNA primase [Alphaproteobacteria bacterium]MBV8549629.1 DNA primase [Alphaproteobacteria bacterium]
MSFPPSFLEELRARLPLSEIVGKRVRLTRAGREFKACCPFHNEKSPSFYINDDKQFFHCFGCGAHGDIIGFTMRHDRLSFPEAVEALAGQAGLPMPRETPMEREKFDQEKRLLNLLDRATAWFEEQLFSPAGREGLSYLRGRGLSDDAMRRFRLGYAPQDSQAMIRKLVSEGFKMEELVSVGLAKKLETRDEFFSFFRHRVMFPVGDRRGRTVAFGGRVLGEGEPKYLNSPDHSLFHKGKLLYGLSRARTAVSQNQPLIVVEGYMDVIALVEAGYSGAVAPLGTAMTEDQMMVLWKLLPPADTREPGCDYSPILCFDGDNAGLRAATRAVERALPIVTPAQTLRVAFMPKGQDPDDLIKSGGKGAMESILTQARPLIDVVWESALTGRTLRTPEDRGSFISNLRQRVSRIGHETLRQLYLDEVNKRIDALLRPQQFQQQGGQRLTAQKSRFSKGQQDIAPPILNRRLPQSARPGREMALLAMMLRYPALFNDFGEDFATLTFTQAPLEAVRQQIVDLLASDSHEPLDATEVYRHLSRLAAGDLSVGYRQAHLDDILSTTALHASLATPDQTLVQVRLRWKSIRNMQLREQLQSDIQRASRIFAENATDENQNRLKALHLQADALEREIDGSAQ